jgi:hypothetical protein
MLTSLDTTLLTELLAFESGIDPRLYAWYCEHIHTPCIDAPVVERPGWCKRDPQTGALLWKKMTVEEYFHTLGVLLLFDVNHPECLKAMQYRSMNALGFVGFQLGEAALRDLGVYTPKIVDEDEMQLESLYSGQVPVSTWAGGRREVRFKPNGAAAWILATDVNRWQGTFTGKFGIHSYEDLLEPANQTRIVIDLMCHNARAIVSTLNDSDAVVSEKLRSCGSDWSGFLAAAHLCGPAAVANYLLWGVASQDEFGTPLQQYLERFARLDVSEVSAACGDLMQCI